MQYPILNIPVINTKPDATITIKLFFNPTTIDAGEEMSINAVLDAWLPFDIAYECPSPSSFLPTDSVLKAAQLITKPQETQGFGLKYSIDDIIKIIHKITKKFETFDINFSTSGIKESSDFSRVYFTTLRSDMEMTLPRCYYKAKEYKDNLPADGDPRCFKHSIRSALGMHYKNSYTPRTAHVLSYLARTVNSVFNQPTNDIQASYENNVCIIFVRDGEEWDAHQTIEAIGASAAHEIGHSLGLGHWGREGGIIYYGGTLDFMSGIWAPLMGNQTVRSVFPDHPGLDQWCKGDYPRSECTPLIEIPGVVPVQDDIKIIEESVTRFLKMRNSQYIDNFENYTRKNTEFGTKAVQCIQVKIIGKDQINSKAHGELVLDGAIVPESQIQNGPDDPNSIIGMIGFPYDFEISKVLVEAGEYEIEVKKYDQSMLDSKITLLHPRIELNKTQYKLREAQLGSCGQKQYVYYNKEIPNDKQFYSCIGFSALNICPICDALPSPTILTHDSANQSPSRIGIDPFIKIKVKKRTFIYILVAGSPGPEDENKTDKNQINLYSRYGSIGKYRIKGIPKDKVSEISEPFDCYPAENSEEFLESEDAPEFHKHYSPRVTEQYNTYTFFSEKTKHFLKTIENGKVVEPVFFLQEKEDFPIENPENKDIPFTKFFPVVINGKLYGQIDGCSNCGPEETKFVVYGKEYSPGDSSSPPEDEVSFYYITNQNGETKKLEFIIYNVESQGGECSGSPSIRNTDRFFSYETLIDFNN